MEITMKRIFRCSLIHTSLLAAIGFAGVLSTVQAQFINPPCASLGADWTQTTAEAPWSARGGASTVIFNGQMYMMGGWNNTNRFNDVWSSSDGAYWTQVTAGAPWSARSDFGAVTFNGKVWVIGGNYSGGDRNDVWSSTDGATWTQVTGAAPWAARRNPGVVVFNGRLWVMGGYNTTDGYLNDVWSSTDGATWTQVTGAAPWAARRLSAGTVMFSGKMWVIGGYNGSGNFADVWSSSDGTLWTQVTGATPWQIASGALAFDGHLWVTGGPIGCNKNVWSSNDGSQWTQMTGATPWNSRCTAGYVAYDGKMWMMGGGTWNPSMGNWSTVYNDVWYSQCGAVSYSFGAMTLKMNVSFVVGKLSSATLKSYIELPEGYDVNNAVVELNVGSVAVPFVLDEKGRGLSGGNSLKFQKSGAAAVSNQLWQVTAKLRGDFDAQWINDGFLNSTTNNLTVTVPVLLLLDTPEQGTVYVEKPLLYKAKAGKSGSAK
ncbi:MAG: hypothetical protein PCFJNLEI_01367 [Verrucomicrobiae bacterium]|nr:hypothetical protein [Verrucomicrobiae bacterium]